MEDETCEFLRQFHYQVLRYPNIQGNTARNAAFVHLFKMLDAPFGHDFMRHARSDLRARFLAVARDVYERNKQYLRPKDARYVKSVLDKFSL